MSANWTNNTYNNWVETFSKVTLSDGPLDAFSFFFECDVVLASSFEKKNWKSIIIDGLRSSCNEISRCLYHIWGDVKKRKFPFTSKNLKTGKCSLFSINLIEFSFIYVCIWQIPCNFGKWNTYVHKHLYNSSSKRYSNFTCRKL